MAYRNPEQFVLSKGRAPIYENELVITEILAEELELSMGDEAAVGYHGNKETYLISGIFQCTDDTGKSFGTSISGAERIGFEPIYEATYSLQKPDMGLRLWMP